MNFELVESIKQKLEFEFPDALIEYNPDGYWDVTTDAGYGSTVESYRLVNGKLVHFATLEMED